MTNLRTLPNYGYGPATPQSRAGLMPADLREAHPLAFLNPYVRAALEYGPLPAQAVVGQFNTATDAVAGAMQDPSLANVTNAGVQTGLAVGSPTVVGAFGLGGLLEGARRDFAPGLFGSATAAENGMADMVKGDPQLEALYAQMKAKEEDGRANVPGRSKAESDRIRADARSEAGRLQQAIVDALAARTNSSLSRAEADYRGAVKTAESARDAWLARDKRFSDTEVGKVYDAMGGLAPLAAGVGYGTLARVAGGPAKSIAGELGRAAGGGAIGFTATNVPLAYNSFATEPDNPQRRAYDEYAYNLPEGHPDKSKAAERAGGMPLENPVRAAASKELYDPWKLAERTGLGLIEGIGGYELGRMVPPAVTATARGAARAPGGLLREVVDGFRNGRAERPVPSATMGAAGAGIEPAEQLAGSQTQSVPVAYRQYSQVPEQTRQNLQNSYVASRALNGQDWPPKDTAKALKSLFAERGVSVPISDKRIKATNDAVEGFVTRFGRPPATPEEWASVFSNKTLAVPAAAVGGGLLSFPPDR